jgi:hypothetical protein
LLAISLTLLIWMTGQLNLQSSSHKSTNSAVVHNTIRIDLNEHRRHSVIKDESSHSTVRSRKPSPVVIQKYDYVFTTTVNPLTSMLSLRNLVGVRPAKMMNDDVLYVDASSTATKCETSQIICSSRSRKSRIARSD